MGKACTKPLHPIPGSHNPTSDSSPIIDSHPYTTETRKPIFDASISHNQAISGGIPDSLLQGDEPSCAGSKSTNRSLAVRLQQLATKGKQLSDLLSLSTGEEDDSKRDLRPPHMIRDGRPRFGNGFRFYVCIYGLRIKLCALPAAQSSGSLPLTKRRSLPSRTPLSSATDSSGGSRNTQHLVVVSWDDGWFVRRTSLMAMGTGLSTAFSNSFLFYWYCDELTALASKNVLLSVYAVHGGKQLIRLGDVRVSLLTVATGPVHHDLPILEEVSPYEMSTHRPTSHTKKHHRLQFNVRMTQICEMLITPIEMMVHVLQNPGTAPESTEILGTVPTTAPNPTQPTSDPPVLRSKSVNELGRSVKNLDDAVAEESQPAPSDNEKIEEDEIEKAAAGGHSNEDGRCPILAKWRLDYAPTGVVNPMVFPSTWTDLTARPYWLSLKVPPALSTPGLHASLTMMDTPHRSPGDLTTSESIDDLCMDVRRSMSHGVSMLPSRPKVHSPPTDENGDTGSKDKLTLKVLSASSAESANASLEGKAQLFRQGSSSLSKGMRLSVIARHELMPTNPSSKNPFTQTEKLDAYWKTSDMEYRSQSGIVFGDMELESTAQSVYRSVALQCRNGNAVTEYIDSKVFPSCHLMTTGDTLRQFHLHLRVWNQPLGVGKPRLFGETWIPFFKLYESDIVEVSEKHFYDAHFCETLWNEGRSVAKLEGLFVFQDSPLIRQMMAGVHTERGFNRIAMPVLGELTSSESAKRSIPKEILMLCQLQADLAASIFATSNIAGVDKGRTREAAPIDIRKTCETILELLTKPSVSGLSDPMNFRSAFVYEDLSSLICGQRVLLDLASHILDMEELVPWNVRGLYGQILSALLKRAELDMGNLIPRIPDFCRRFQDVDIRELTRAARRMEQLTNRENAKVQTYLSDTRSPASTKSSIRRLHVFSKFKYNGIPSVRRKDNTSPSLRPDSLEDLMNTTNPLSALLSNSSSKSTETQAIDEKSCPLSPTDRSSNDDRKDDSSFSDADHRASSSRRSSTHLEDEIAAATETPRVVPRTLTPKLPLLSHEISDLVMYHKRMKLSKMYLMLLLRLKRYGLSKVCSEALFESQRRQLCSHLAILLIRLPSFRDELLAKVLTTEERYAIVPGWRGQEFALDKESLDLHDKWVSKTFPGLYEVQVAFDWDPFHNSLMEYFGPDTHEKIEASLAASDSCGSIEGWTETLLRPRGIVFLTLLEAWIRVIWQTIQWQRRFPQLGIEVDRQTYARSNSSAMNIRWDLIPGYATLLKAFLIEIRTRPIAKFPDALLNCSAALLVNDKLLSVFMRMVLTRTSVFSREQVFAVLNYIDFWLEVLSLKNRPLPLTFDCRFLGRALETVVTSDLALQTAKGLWFVYKRMELLNTPKMLQILLDLLVYRRFNDLIMHWSWLVRKCFVSLLLYRLCEAARRIMARHSDVKATQKSTKALSESDRMVLWAFVLMSRSLSALGLHEVFPSRFLNTNLRQILCQPADPPEATSFGVPEVSTPLLWNVPLVLPTIQCTTVPYSAPEAVPENHEIQPSPQSVSRVQSTAPEPAGDTQPPSPATLTTHHVTFQRPVRVYRQGLKRIRRRRSHREEPDVESKTSDLSVGRASNVDVASVTEQPDDPYNYLPPAIDVEPRHRPYNKCLIKEFATELEAYKVWVISGTAEVPPMHIPASPLDTNVDIPLEDE